MGDGRDDDDKVMTTDDELSERSDDGEEEGNGQRMTNKPFADSGADRPHSQASSQ